MALDLDADTREIVAQVGRFAARHLRVCREQPETELDHAALGRFAGEAEDMGLLGGGPEADYGLWFAADGAALGQGIGILRALGAVSGEAALHVHWEALSARVLTDTGVAEEDGPRPWLRLAGGPGWPAEALTAWCRGGLDGAGYRRLRTWWDPEDGLLLLAPRDRRAILLPVVDDAGTAFWSHRELPEPAADGLSPLHAPAGWSGRRLRLGAESPRPLAGLDAARWHELWALSGAGLLAVGLGILDDLAARAREYARNRRQGGVLIQAHAAVQQLLAELSLACRQGEALLNALLRPAAEPLWHRVAQARAVLHPAFCRAANAAMQVHGGIGYMRDTGIERGVRMQNALRCLNGTPPDLRRWTAIWEQNE
jgi:alkylation response protein AidB-like acyl-CoA dehydrogenase